MQNAVRVFWRARHGTRQLAEDTVGNRHIISGTERLHGTIETVYGEAARRYTAVAHVL